ncbi:ogr/Delta-like zinc finger family protein [Salmonella enterica]|nr:late control protein B [Salmonella enterica subsp. diarizonae]EEB7406983.1 late control protein B [Salmonella enterica]EIS9097421.1 ogr/Delta-like zinc finger family protein [Salmonella enterica]EIT2135955.1 ogr/Delta-like zinc finger family protein [Salmonella enterica]EIZ2109998.1 ogr/Delta-like zinc finger family protein [Salmonella enterica]
MFRCPACGSSGHVRTSEYISENVKKSWYVCVNKDCMRAYTTLESYEKMLTEKVFNDEKTIRTECRSKE